MVELDPTTIFQSDAPSVARVPNLITFLDAELLGALTRINGAKMGVWHFSPAYDENDHYQPYREDLPFDAWSLAYNQGELRELTGYANTLVYGNDSLVVDCTADQDVLTAAEKLRGEGGYQDLPDFPGVLNKIGWALMSVGPERQFALIAASEGKRSYIEMLQSWCLDRGRATYSVALAEGHVQLRLRQPAPDAKSRAVYENGMQLIAKLTHFGMSPEEIRTTFDALMQDLISKQQSQS